MTERRRAPIEVLERLAEAVSLYAEMFTDERERTRQWPDKIMPLVLAYRAATAPLRTRASVDAEIVAEARAAFRDGRQHVHIPILFEAMERLCSEPTADEPEASPASPAWRTGTKNSRVIYDGNDMIGAMDTPDDARRVVRAVTGHGSSSTPAAKESRDNAGVPAGPANALVDRVLASDEPEPEKCGCEETEALRDEVNELRQLLDYARRTAQDIVTVLEEARK